MKYPQAYQLVPQGILLGPLLYVLYTPDLLTSENTTIGMFDDDTAIVPNHEKIRIVFNHIQQYSDHLQQWLHKWRIKVNENKLAHVTSTLRRESCSPVIISNKITN